MSRDLLFPLTISEVVNAVDFPWSPGARRLRSRLVCEFELIPEDAKARVLGLAEEKKEEIRRRQRRRMQEERRQATVPPIGPQGVDTAKFMDLPSAEDVRRCHSAYLHELSNNVLREVVCVVCALETRQSECTATAVDSIPNGRLLAPSHTHPAHTLERDMLLECSALFDGADVEGVRYGWICDVCLKTLKAGVRPKLALANNMWIGSVPDELCNLTVPEQMLIALHYPKAFVYKLFTRDGVIRDPELLQRGMSGNVTVYPIELKDIVGMLEGNLLPRRPELLASVIAICFVGLGRLPKRWLKGTFRVRRGVVHTALRWLKQNNPLYRDMEISEERLLLLPENSVPRELLATVRTERSATTARREREGYVPDSDSSESEDDDSAPSREAETRETETEMDSLSAASESDSESGAEARRGENIRNDL